MSTALLIGIIGVITVLVLIALRMPIGFVLFIVGFLGVAAIRGFKVAFANLYISTYGTATNPAFTVLPFFILVGALVAQSGAGGLAFNAIYRWLGRLPGGLGIATVGTSAIFAACCGSSPASAATMSKICMPEMKKYGYANSLSAGTTAAGGLLAILIPPSASFILYGILTTESISQLLMAGWIPGIILALAFMFIVFLTCKIKPSMGPKGERFTWREKFASLPNMWGVLLIIVLISGGIFLGIFTPTEAGAASCLVAGIMMAANLRSKFATPFFQALWECASMTAMIFFIILGAQLFSALMLQSGLSKLLIDTVTSLGINSYLVLVVILLIYIPLGMFLESGSLMLITIPIFYPIVTGLGFDGIWFGVILVMMIEIGMLTPPVGMNCYVIAGLNRDISLTDVFRGAMPFVVAELAVVAIVIIFPQLALWLPSMMIT